MVNEVILLEIAILQRNEDSILTIDMTLEAILRKDLKMGVGENELLLREDEEDQVQPLTIMKDEGEDDDHTVHPQNQIEKPKDKDDEELLLDPHQTTEDEDSSTIQVKRNLQNEEKMNEKTQRQIQYQTEE